MGYDFTFMVLRPDAQLAFPMGGTAAVEAMFDVALPAASLDQALSTFPSIRHTPKGWRWEVPEGGTLDLLAFPGQVHVDTHAAWEAVLEVYLHLVAAGKLRLAILDGQAGWFHDEASFRAFLDGAWQQAPPQAPLTAARVAAALATLAERRDVAAALAFANGPLPADPRPLLALCPSVPDGPPQLVEAVIRLLGRIGPAAAPRAPEIAARVRASDDPRVRGFGVDALGEIGAADPSAVDLLGELAAGTSALRPRALRALLAVGRDDLALGPLVAALAQDARCRFAGGCASAFDGARDPDAAWAALGPADRGGGARTAARQPRADPRAPAGRHGPRPRGAAAGGARAACRSLNGNAPLLRRAGGRARAPLS